MRGAAIALLLLWGMVPAASGQVRVRGQSSIVFESYSFDSDEAIETGLGLERVSELTIPLVATLELPRYGELTVASGYASVDFTRLDEAGASSEGSISGALNTDLRLGVNLIPGTLKFLVFGSIDAGSAEIRTDEVQTLQVMASDVIGFAAAQVGNGPAAGTGLVAAIPAGRFAVGFGATVRQPYSYEPVEGTSLDPGFELRWRVGMEGPLSARTYMRAAVNMATRSRDEISRSSDASAADSIIEVGVGTRLVGYLSVNQGVGPTSLTLYTFDAFRSNPSFEVAGLGAAVQPRGNLFAAGATWSIPIDPATQITPQAEFRISHAACDEALCGPGVDTGMSRMGTSGRLGLELRRSLSSAFSVVLNGSGAVGDVRSVEGLLQDADRVGFSGYRLGIRLEGYSPPF